MNLLTTYRGLVRRPAFLLAVILTMGLGIGANSAIFSVIDAVLLKPLPYPGAERLTAIYESNSRQKAARSDVAPIRLEEWNRMNHTFVALSGAYTENQAETSGPLPEKFLVARAAPRLFTVLGTPPIAGRAFAPDEELPNGPAAAVISERLWRRRFHADPQAIGSVLRLSSGGFPIVGVVPDSVDFPAADVDVWVPSRLSDVVMRSRVARYYTAVGRLREGVDLRAGQADLAAVQGRLALQYPATDSNWTAVVDPLKERTVGSVRGSLWILFAAVSLVLMIACANVACLLLSQAARREREIAMRLALGAGRARIAAEQLAETLCAVIPGAVLGLILAAWGVAWFRRAAAGLPRATEILVDWRMVLFALSLTVLTSLLCGLFPAFHATRRGVSGMLAQGGRGQVGGRRSSLQWLVASQMALAIVLLVGAGLLIRTLASLQKMPLGFRADNVLVLHISASFDEKRDMRRVQQRFQRTLDALASTPGLEGAAISADLPGTGEDYPQQFSVVGKPDEAEGQKTFADVQAVSPDYFRVLAIPLVAGEVCRVGLETNRVQEVMVNRSFVDAYLSDRSPVQQHLKVPLGTVEIKGVVGDVREHGYSRDPRPTIYYCELPAFFPDPNYLVKTAGSPATMVEPLRRVLQALEPTRAMYDAKPLSDSLSATLEEKRFQTTLLSLFGLTALFLAAVGLYGVMSFLVAQRSREIGLRTALGARPGQILGQVIRQGGATTGAGIAVGIIAAATLSRWMSSLLFRVAPLDAITFLAAPAILGAVALIALWGPAWRATQVDPIEALRSE